MARAVELWSEAQSDLAAISDPPEDRLAIARKRVDEATEDLLENARSMEASQKKIEGQFDALFKMLGTEIQEGQPSLDIDEVVDVLSGQEERLKAALLPDIEETERNRREVFGLPLEIRGRVLHMHTQRLASLYRILEFIRDARWQMMCLRADLERSDAGPTFEDAGALERYLDKI